MFSFSFPFTSPICLHMSLNVFFFISISRVFLLSISSNHRHSYAVGHVSSVVRIVCNLASKSTKQQQQQIVFVLMTSHWHVSIYNVRFAFAMMTIVYLDSDKMKKKNVIEIILFSRICR